MKTLLTTVRTQQVERLSSLMNANPASESDSEISVDQRGSAFRRLLTTHYTDTAAGLIRSELLRHGGAGFTPAIRSAAKLAGIKPAPPPSRRKGILTTDFTDNTDTERKPAWFASVIRTRQVERLECRALLKAGAFFLLPEWTTRWREIFTRDLGLNRDNARGLMHDAHRKLVYLDTGIVPVPTEDLQACAEHCGLPWEILPVSLEPLRAAIAEARARVAAPEVVP